jgi:hypothetical protein
LMDIEMGLVELLYVQHCLWFSSNEIYTILDAFITDKNCLRKNFLFQIYIKYTTY